MDAITLLKSDHKTVEQLFKRFEKAGDRAFAEKRKVVDRIVEELSIHAAIEEQVLYPLARDLVPASEDMTLEALEEHHIVKWLLSELDGLDPQHERFDAKVTVLIENVRHHVKEEEQELFPKLRDGLTRAQLDEIGRALETAKQSAPTKPHPRSPDEPPANAVVGTIAGVMDRVGGSVSGIAQGSVSAVQDLIARIRGMSPPKTSPTGSRDTRDRADAVRSAASNATDTVARTAKAASSGAKATMTTAKKSASATKTTAKRAATTTARTARGQTKKTAAASTRPAAKKPATRSTKSKTASSTSRS